MSTTNTFSSMKPNYKEAYPKKKRFEKVSSMMQPKGKATAELDASKNPMKWMKSHKTMSIKKLRGVAF